MAEDVASREPVDSPALPPYVRALIRQTRQRGAATPDREARIRERSMMLEAVLDDGNRKRAPAG